jgi:hypothetical protein
MPVSYRFYLICISLYELLFLQDHNKDCNKLENKKKQLEKKATDILVLQAEAWSALKAKIIIVDKQAEDLMGVDDEASEKLFVEKQTLELELHDLDLKHSTENDHIAEKLRSCRKKLVKQQEAAKGILLAVRDDFIGHIMSMSTMGQGTSTDFLQSEDHPAIQKDPAREDHFDQPFLTGVPKIQLKVMGKMLKDCLDRNTFNNLAKPVDPKIGDLYIYKCGAIPPVHAIDSTNWKHSHTDTRKNQIHFPGRILDQITYVRRDDLAQKKVILFDSLRGLVVVHYR